MIFKQFIADGFRNIDYLSTAFIPRDIPQDIADAWRLYMVLAHSKRPVDSGAFTRHMQEIVNRLDSIAS